MKNSNLKPMLLFIMYNKETYSTLGTEVHVHVHIL